MDYSLYIQRPIMAHQNEDGTYTALIFGGQEYYEQTIPQSVFERAYQPYDGSPAQIDVTTDDGTTFKQPSDADVTQANIQAATTSLNNVALMSARTALVGGDITSIKTNYENALKNISDDIACKICSYFPLWIPLAHSYKKGDRVNYNGTLYKVLQDHISQVLWTPDKSPSLFAKVLTSEDGTPKEWEQPDSTNAYMKGDKVTYQGKIYESTIDNNVWSPVAYPQGWKEVTE